ncbi:glycosyltransferase family 4 protein [Gimesia aquarii]|uniref:D-inositol 3-phosphate glycosyltransferase n=1 Tax=Gimesia aquarii TaxID=2527964 RepID=A0A517WZT2_9PLAN|nr:glycosyltransferase family 4 protein [Gimesia aquarii]QDU10764.1 D-inositol 3-phosphate glycosyltransferase [Gimesia aquarii]
MRTSHPCIGIGPVYPGIGSWEWIGEEMAEELSQFYDIEFFSDSIPACDLALIVKYDFSKLMSSRSPDIPVIFCPVDCYGSARDIDRDGKWLFQCRQILIHCESLRKYFCAYAPVEYIDHHLRFISKTLTPKPAEGPILWTGLHSNLHPLIEWVNQHSLPQELWILTNLEPEIDSIPQENLGFASKHSIRIEHWTPPKHVAWAELASSAIDVKGTDFRARHKPPAKAIDHLASGLPLAMNRDSSSVKHLARLGFEVAAVEDQDYWFSEEYRTKTIEFASDLRETLSRENIGKRLKTIIDTTLNTTESQREKRQSTPRETKAASPQRNYSFHSNLETNSVENTKIGIVSFLYNWPSTGGGNIHTTELVQFLGRAGYDVQHICVRYDPWQIGQIESDAPIPSQVLNFTPSEWNANHIRKRVKDAVYDFDPDFVIITDSWNFKPHLAEAVSDYPYFLRMQAQECLCPLNNLQMLPGPEGLTPCPQNQFFNSEDCFHCLIKNRSGELHQLERQLSGVGSSEYHDLLQQSFHKAEAVLVLNPMIAKQYKPFCNHVEVVTWGMDESRFPWPFPSDEQCPPEISKDKISVIFAGLVHEPIKGFPVLLAACEQLWETRQDFELIVTSDSPQQQQEFTKYVGWKSQLELPLWYRHCDLCAVPTIVPDGLSRTSVEAMACGLPVIASHIGGLPCSVSDQETGLLCNPGDVADWVSKLNQLLDRPERMKTLGEAGRAVFEERFRWGDVIERDYKRLFNQSRCVVSN